MDDCLFCKIARGEIPSKTVHSDEKLYAFEDIAPKAPTHVLAIPRKHVSRLDEASPADKELLGDLLLLVAKIARDRKLSDYRLVVNNGPEAGQSVFHLHMHLLGGRPMRWPPG
jgi:histidine triad (HIT) family protein